MGTGVGSSGQQDRITCDEEDIDGDDEGVFVSVKAHHTRTYWGLIVQGREEQREATWI